MSARPHAILTSNNMKEKVRQKKITRISKLTKIEKNFIFDICQWYLWKKEKITVPGRIRHEVLFTYLSNNGCAGILFKFFDESDYQIQEKIKGYYRDEYLAILQKNTIFIDTAANIDNICRSARINYVMIKGIALIESIYREKGVRSLTDIDLVVESREKALLLIELLQSKTHMAPTVFGAKFKDQIHFICSIYNQRYGQHVEVEIHFPLRVSIMHSNELFYSISKRLFSKNLRISQINIPDPSAHFLILLFHLVHHHMGARLIWYLDIACLLSEYSKQMDWKMILQECEQLEFKNILFHILQMLKKKFGIDIPETVLKKAGDTPGVNNGILREMVSPKNTIMDSFGGGEIFRHPVLSLKRLKPVILYPLSPFLFNDKKGNWYNFKQNSKREKRIMRDEISIFLFKQTYTDTNNILKRITVRFFSGLFSLISYKILVYYNIKNRKNRDCTLFSD